MFQAVFGMIFTVIIALEFKRSLLVVTERRRSVVQVRTVVLLAMLLAIVRKPMIVELATTDALQLLALATAIVGAVYWLVRDQDPRDVAQGPPWIADPFPLGKSA